jgi:hypothetical protein
MKTTVEIADPLFDEAKREAERSGCTLRDLLELGLQRELERRKQHTRPFTLRDASVQGLGVRPGVRESDGRALRAYAYMGTPGMPETVEGINKMLDEEDAPDRGDP